MPSKKKKYNARFPAGRIKKIMQTDEEVGKVAQAVPVIISRTLELFVESLLTKSMQITLTRNAKTLTPSHMKQCILSESRFDFLKDLVKNIPDASVQEDNENNALEVVDYSVTRTEQPKEEKVADVAANFYTEQSTSTGRTPVIQYSPKVPKVHDQIKIEVPSLVPPEVPKLNYIDSAVYKQSPSIHIDLSSAVAGNCSQPPASVVPAPVRNSSSKPSAIPATAPIAAAAVSSNYGQNTSDNLYIDEDYDN